MQIIKTPTGTIKVDETTKKLTQAEYNALGDNKKDGIYLITDSSKKNIIGLYKDGAQINNFPASKIALTPSGNITKSNVQEAIIENDSHITTTKNNLSSHVNNTSNPHKVTKTQVGLGNVDNTSDANKPVSTAQKKAIDAVNTSLTTHTGNTTVHITAAERTKWNDKSDINSINSKIGTSDISAVGTTITGAISSLATTIGVGNPSSGGTTLTGDISTLKSNLSSHINNTTVHITAAERTAWNSKAARNHTHSWSEIGSKPSSFTPSAGSLNYVQVSHSGEIATNINCTFDDLAKDHFTMARIYQNVDDNNITSGWYHCISMGWTEGSDENVSQIAINNDISGMWYRTLSSESIANIKWINVLDSSNYKTYCTPANIGAASSNHTHSWDSISNKPSSFNPSSGSLNYVRVYNSSNVGNSNAVTFNDLAKQHSAVAMINPATDNPVGKKSWCHCISMAWTNGSNANWVSQIALGTEANTGMYYRTTNNAITGRGWNRVLDSANYTSYCTPGKVKQSNITAANDYRILISASANDTEETNQVYKSSKLTFNPYLGAFACGNSTVASGNSAHAEGDHTIASGSSSHAEGAHTCASGVGSHAEGHYTTSAASNGGTVYNGNTASGKGSHAEGIGTLASGDGSHAEGIETLANGGYSHAEGGTQKLLAHHTGTLKDINLILVALQLMLKDMLLQHLVIIPMLKEMVQMHLVLHLMPKVHLL